jgi:hypothetical protein
MDAVFSKWFSFSFNLGQYEAHAMLCLQRRQGLLLVVPVMVSVNK